jgi:DNA-binding response OmpR family regulator
VIVLDAKLPDQSGFDVCAALRGRRHTPLIMLTSRSDRSDAMRALDAGVDDFVTKPFDLPELVTRVHGVLRRSHASQLRLTLGRVTVDLQTFQAWNGTERLDLSHREFELLKYLAERPGRVVSRAELLREVWGFAAMPNTRSVDHAIARLRRKIEPDVHRPRFIHTVYGDGYSFTPDSPERLSIPEVSVVPAEVQVSEEARHRA